MQTRPPPALSSVASARPDKAVPNSITNESQGCEAFVQLPEALVGSATTASPVAIRKSQVSRLQSKPRGVDFACF